jgi:ABC-2 type transport system ATP-binding protein
VLAVGDQPFREKCLARMHHLREQGATIVLVSHDSSFIRNFCTRALLLDAGAVVFDGRPEEAVQAYDWRLSGFAGNRPRGVEVSRVEVTDCQDAEIGTLLGSSIRVRVSYDAEEALAAWLLVARVRRDDGAYCASCSTETPRGRRGGVAIAQIEDLNLTAGSYALEVSIEDAVTRKPVATRASKSFVVPRTGSPNDAGRPHDGVMKVRHLWSFD